MFSKHFSMKQHVKMQQYTNKTTNEISTNTVVTDIPCCGATSTFSWSWSGLVSTSITYTDELVTTTAWFSLTNNCSVTSNGSSSLINYGNKIKALDEQESINKNVPLLNKISPPPKKFKNPPSNTLYGLIFFLAY